MDKYTVDLDKVLNDFEYSELTEQLESQTYAVPTDAKNRAGNAKHSINNVFSSLNEYLNTEIVTRVPKETINNNTAASTSNDTYYNYSYTPDRIEEVRNQYQPSDRNDRIDQPNTEISFPISIELPKEIATQKIDIEAINIDGVANTIDTAFKNEIGSNFNQGGCELEVQYDQRGNVASENADHDISSDKNEANNTSIRPENETEIPQFVNFESSNIESSSIRSTVEVAAYENTLWQSQNHINIPTIPCEDVAKPDNELNKSSEISKSNEEVTENKHEIVEPQIHVITLPSEQFETKPESEIDRIVIATEDALPQYEDIKEEAVTSAKQRSEANSDYGKDESHFEAVSKYLATNSNIKTTDELIKEPQRSNQHSEVMTAHSENEYKHDIIATPQLDVSNINLEASKSNTKLPENHESKFLTPISVVPAEIPASVDKSDLATVKGDDEVTGNEGTIVTDNTNDNNLNNEMQNSGRKIEIVERINNNLVPKPPEKVGFEAVDVDEAELQSYLDELEDDDDDDDKFEDCKSDEKPKTDAGTDGCDIEFEKCSVRENENVVQNERPNSLDIGQKKEINLIGNPGSTPYNNLYGSKEIVGEKSKHHYESESSASVSPTFSEASTDSVRSTDSTDTEQDGKAGATAEASGPVQEMPAETAGGSSADATTIDVTRDEEDVYVDIDSINRNVGAITEEEMPEIGEDLWLGKRAPVWIPDADALNCLHCDMKFTVIKRRHHCRACGLVLCSKCCNMKYRLEYLDQEARVCTKCHDVLSRDSNSSGSEVSPRAGNSPHHQAGQPNPNNPMEYCSVVPPLQQVSGSGDNPPTVMVPVGVLKRKGSNKAKHNKSVMFCDGIRPGSDLTNLDNDFNYNDTRSAPSARKQLPLPPKVNRNVPLMDPNTKSFIPENESCLPPTVTTFKSDITYTDCANNANVVEMLKNETLTFALQRNLQVHVRLITMDCCINKQAWCFSTEGLISVGQDEVVFLLECIDNEKVVPKDIFRHINNIYSDAVKGTTVTELGLSMHPTTNFLDSKNHAGFIYIRSTLQCLQHVIIPKEPYLFGILVHRWETPWAKIFPLRLVLRLGAEYRYYPSPIISTRHRDSVFVEIGHTIINLLADFRNFSYTLPNIRGLTIHMEEKNTTVTIPVNRYDQVMKSISNSSDHILAFGGNFSAEADSHLVCIQDTHGNNENNYTTHAINIQNKPRKVTGASFIVFNGALKSTSGLTAKSNIVEDGLMIQIPAEQMIQVRDSLKDMKNFTIHCGCVNATSDEAVNIVWGEPDINFNIGVKSSVDEQSLSGVPSIRVHNGKDYVCNSGNRLIRWTEVFLLQNGEENARTQDPVDVSKVAENISKATCQALVKYLDLLATNNFYKIGIRTTLHVENVSYSAGSNGIKLPPIYMKSLDNELVPVLHRITSNNLGDGAIVLELIFRILNV